MNRTRILVLASLLFYLNPTFAITWKWVGSDAAVVNNFKNNYDYGSGKPLSLTNINDELDSNMLDDFYGMVPEKQQVSADLLNSTFDNISIKEDLPEDQFATVKVTFLNEGAGYKNALGYFIYDTDNPPSSTNDVQHILIFPNSSKYGSGGGLKQGDQVDLKIELTAGQSIGFFINSNGWAGKYGKQKNYFLYGQPFYTLPSLNPSVGLGQRYHVILSDSESSDDDTGYFAYGFEDIKTSGGDRDYNDLIFNVAVTPVSAVDNLEDVIEIESVSDEIISKVGTLAFEDNWPMVGDYDFNDAVLAYNITQKNNGETNNEYIKSIVLDYDIKAIGATFHNGIAVSIPGLSESMIKSVSLEKSRNGVTKTITQDTNIKTYISSGTQKIEKTYPYPLIKDSGSANVNVSFTLSENIFEELSTFDEDDFVYETHSCMFRTTSNGGCKTGTTSSSLKLTIVLNEDVLLKSDIGDMPFDTYMFGSHKNNIYRFPRGRGSVNDWFTPWSIHHNSRDSANGPGPGNFLEIHLKQFSGTAAFESDFTEDDYVDAKVVDAQNTSNGGNRFISRQLMRKGVSVGNLPWVLDLPENWQHPKERVDINHAYPNFVQWVEDNDTYQNWYEVNVKTGKLYTD